MSPINISKIEQEARKMRAAEMQRVQGLVYARLALVARLMAGSVLAALSAIGENLRPLFAWNPHAPATPTATCRPGPGLPTRLSLALRGLFSWNPQARRS